MSSTHADDAAFHVRECNAIMAQLRQAARSPANKDCHFLMQSILLRSESDVYDVLEKQSKEVMELISRLSFHVSALGRAATTPRPKSPLASETWLQVFEFLDAETLPAVQLCGRTFHDLVARQRTTLALFKVDVVETVWNDDEEALSIEASNGWTWCAEGGRKHPVLVVRDMLFHSYIGKLEIGLPFDRSPHGDTDLLRTLKGTPGGATFVDVNVKRFEFSEFPPRTLCWFVFEALASVKELEPSNWDDGSALDREFRLRCKALGISIVGRNAGGVHS